MFEITSDRYRFGTPREALAAAASFEACDVRKGAGDSKSEDLNFMVEFTVGDTEGWAVEVWPTAGRSYMLGNLRPIST